MELNYFEWVQHLFVNRASFFFVAQSMLLAAFATFATAARFYPVIVMSLATFGVVMAVVWIVAAHDQHGRIGRLEKALGTEPLFSKIAPLRRVPGGRRIA